MCIIGVCEYSDHPTRFSLPVLKVGLMIVRIFFQFAPRAFDNMSLANLSPAERSFKGYEIVRVYACHRVNFKSTWI